MSGPLLDVTDVVEDPDFQDDFAVYQTALANGANGDPVETPLAGTPVAALGVVQPATSDDMQRLPEGMRQAGALTIYTMFPLCNGGLVDGTSRNADVVTYLGARYVVKTADDWSRWGRGWVRAICSKLDVDR